MTDNSTVTLEATHHTRGWALAIVSLGTLMISLDATIVNVALPSIKVALGFSQQSLVWVVSAYLLPFGGFLLLSGRLGDLFGHGRLFLLGILLFTLASLGCGLAGSRGPLITARALQGLGAAFVSAVAFSLTINLFPQQQERAKAMSILSFVSIGGGGTALLLGGTLTSVLGWRWIFFVNLPIGAAVFALGLTLLPKRRQTIKFASLDIGGAFAMTTSLLLALYAVSNGGNADRTAGQTFTLLATSLALLLAFFRIESRTSVPLIPIAVLRVRTLVATTVIGILLSASFSSWYFICTMYLQLVLHYSPIRVSLVFLPSNLLAAAFTLGLSARIVIRFGLRPPLMIGLAISGAAFALFVVSPVNGSFLLNVLPGTLLLALGLGIASTPLMLASVVDVASEDSGLASGVFATASMMGATIGLAVIVRVAASRTNEVLTLGADSLSALNSGYQLAFCVGGTLMIIATLVAAAISHVKV